MLRISTAAASIMLSASLASAMPDASAFINKVCKDGDKTISLGELNAYASQKFVELKQKGRKSLSREALADRISAADFATANNGNRKDQTLSQSEFVRYVDMLFKDACKDGDRSISEAELNSPVGQKLMRLLQ